MKANRYVTITVLGALSLAGCDGDLDNDGVVLSGDFEIAYVERAAEALTDPIDPIAFRAGGDLYIQELASPSASRRNITRPYTGGQGDVAHVDVSPDGTRLVFAMRASHDATWNLWEYDVDTDQLRRLIADDDLANRGDDIMPAYLPDGRIVFSSNRQAAWRETADDPPHLDAYLRHPASMLHVLSADGTQIEQITFAPTHDLYPAVLGDGRIIFSRWRKFGSRSDHVLYTVNPDGSGAQLLYGARSPGNSHLHPRELPDGRLLATVAPISGTRGGGALQRIDINRFADADDPVPGSGAVPPGQAQVSFQTLPLDRESSAYGRFAHPFPLWDGSDRALVAFTPNRNALRPGNRSEGGPPHFGIYMLDMVTGAQRAIALPKRGRVLVNPVTLTPRPAPATLPHYPRNDTLAHEPNDLGGVGMAILNIKSVYDPGFLSLDDDRPLLEGESVPRDANGLVDLAVLRDPAQTRADERLARFIRVNRALPSQPGLPATVIGNTTYPRQQLLGYAQVEPDGSVRVKVPADTPLSIAVLDVRGRNIQTLPDWISLRPGEERACDGCNLPRHFDPLNGGKTAGPWENSVARYTAQSGETQAETRTRVGPPLGQLDALELFTDLSYRDVWTDPAQAGREPDPERNISYRVGPGGVLKETAIPRDGLINYPEHIQYGLWDRPRAGNTCYSCHNANNPAAGLDLSHTVLAPSGRLRSYEQLTRGAPLIDPATGEPRLETLRGQSVQLRDEPLVQVGNGGEGARNSRLYQLFVDAEPDSPHRLNDAELRLLAEWLDNGAQYYNQPFFELDPDDIRQVENRFIEHLDATMAGAAQLDRAEFDSRVHPALMHNCAACHQAPSAVEPTDDLFGDTQRRNNRFVLTGQARGDLGAVRAWIDDLCEPESSALLRIPSTASGEHPIRHGRPALAVDSADYTAVLNWLLDVAAEVQCEEPVP